MYISFQLTCIINHFISGSNFCTLDYTSHKSFKTLFCCVRYAALASCCFLELNFKILKRKGVGL
uniref:Uncharacterized protein n=1 Tax=Rhizophora mucronata TaxID=61149 RepID=A0A2P2JSC9_RHIMU